MATRDDDEAAPGEGELRGTVEHVGSGRRQPFRDSGELLAFLQTQDPRQAEEVDEQ